MYGLVLGLMAATALSSVAFLGWIRSALQREERLAALGETRAPRLS
jgi:hypothetical protein